MIINMIFGLVIAAILGISIVGAHEVGHVKTLEQYGRKAVIKYNKKLKCFVAGSPKNYKGLTKQQLKRVYINGILAGFIPVIILMLALESYWPLLIIPSYMLGCRYDITELKRLGK